MDSSLERYLNNHLAGSTGAVDLIQSIADALEDPEEARFFSELKGKVENDRSLLKELLKKLGQNESGLLKAAGRLTAKAGKMKLRWEGFEPGELGLFEAMEILVLGILGKRLLWAVLGEITPMIPEWEGVSFSQLEKEAIEQAAEVEARRITAGLEALVDGTRSSASPDSSTTGKHR